MDPLQENNSAENEIVVLTPATEKKTFSCLDLECPLKFEFRSDMFHHYGLHHNSETARILTELFDGKKKIKNTKKKF
jgi:hypothetical protein